MSDIMIRFIFAISGFLFSDNWYMIEHQTLNNSYINYMIYCSMITIHHKKNNVTIFSFFKQSFQIYIRFIHIYVYFAFQDHMLIITSNYINCSMEPQKNQEKGHKKDASNTNIQQQLQEKKPSKSQSQQFEFVDLNELSDNEVKIKQLKQKPKQQNLKIQSTKPQVKSHTPQKKPIQQDSSLQKKPQSNYQSGQKLKQLAQSKQEIGVIKKPQDQKDKQHQNKIAAEDPKVDLIKRKQHGDKNKKQLKQDPQQIKVQQKNTEGGQRAKLDHSNIPENQKATNLQKKFQQKQERTDGNELQQKPKIKNNKVIGQEKDNNKISKLSNNKQKSQKKQQKNQKNQAQSKNIKQKQQAGKGTPNKNTKKVNIQQGNNESKSIDKSLKKNDLDKNNIKRPPIRKQSKVISNVKDLAIKQVKQQQSKIDKKQRILTLQYLLNEGFCILLLFGSKFSKKLRNKTMSEVGISKKVIRVSEHDFIKLIVQVWPSVANYQACLPLLWMIIKDSQLNSLSLRLFDQYLKICQAQTNQFMEKLLQTVPPSKIEAIIKKIQKVAQKEDLLDTKTIDKTIILNIFKDIANMTLQLDEQLLSGPNKVKYNILLGPNYLGTGKQLKKFLYFCLGRKIFKFIKAIRDRKKNKKKGDKKKNAGVSTGRKSAASVGKKQKIKAEQKAVSKFLEIKKKNMTDDKKKNHLFMKKIVFELISDAVQQAYTQIGNHEMSEIKQIKKHIYVTQPQLSELQYYKQKKILSIKTAWQNTSAIMNKDNIVEFIDIVTGQKLSNCKIQGSKVLKSSLVKDYLIVDNKIVVLRQDGLLMSQLKNQPCFEKVIHTGYNPIKIQSRQISEKVHLPQKIIEYSEGIIFVNCSQNLVNKIQLYDAKELKLIGVMFLNKIEIGITFEMVRQAEKVLQNFKDNLTKMDKFLNYQSYCQILEGSHIRKNRQGNYELGVIIFSKNKHITVGQLSQQLSWIVKNKFYSQKNYIPLPTSMYDELINKKNAGNSKYICNYLLKYNYIEKQLQYPDKFLHEYNSKLFLKSQPKVVSTDEMQRKKKLLTLYEDYPLAPINQKYPFLSKKQFIKWLQPCFMVDESIRQLLNSQQIQYNCQGLIDLSAFIRMQHYQNITYWRLSQSAPRQPNSQGQRKYLDLPNAIISQFIAIPSLDMIICTLSFPFYCSLWIFQITSGRLIRRTDIETEKYQQEGFKKNPIISYCQQSGYIISAHNGKLQVWNPLQFISIESRQCLPLRNVSLTKQDIVSIKILYRSSTILALTPHWLKIYDLQQLQASNNKEFDRTVFTIKPGYKAKLFSQKNIQPSIMLKKKLPIRGIGHDFTYALTTTGNQIISILSTNEHYLFVKVFHLNKYKIVIKPQKRFEQIPLKLMKQLYQMAAKNRYLISKPQIQNWANDQQIYQNIVCIYTELMGKHLQQAQQKKNLAKSQILDDLNEMTTLLSSRIYNYRHDKLLIDKRSKIALIIALLTSQDSLQFFQNNSFLKLVNPEIFKMYQIQNSKSSFFQRSELLIDILETQEKKFVSRLLYLCSLIQCYSQPFNCSLEEIITKSLQNKDLLDFKMIVDLVASSESIPENIIKNIVSTLNSLYSYRNSFIERQVNNLQQKKVDQLEKELQWMLPVRIVSKIINKFIPTRYKYLCPRYYKEVFEGRWEQAPQFVQYIINRFELMPTKQQIKQELLKQKQKNQLTTIRQWIKNHRNYKNLKLYQSIFKRHYKNNYQFIRLCQSYKIITQLQAIRYILEESEHPTPLINSHNFQLQKENRHLLKTNYDEIIGFISYKIDSQKILLPKPLLDLSFFKQNLLTQKLVNQASQKLAPTQSIRPISNSTQYYQSICQETFYSLLQGNKRTQTIYTQQLLNLMQLAKLFISIQYKNTFWDTLIREIYQKSFRQKELIREFLAATLQIQGKTREYMSMQEILSPAQIALHNCGLISAEDLYTILAPNCLQDPEIFIKVCVCACKSDYSFIEEFLQKYKKNQIKAQSLNNKYINIDHLFNYCSRKIKQIGVVAEIKNKEHMRKGDKIELKIPAIYVLRSVLGKSRYISDKIIATLLQKSLNNITFGQYDEIMKTLFHEKSRMKYLDPSDIYSFGEFASQFAFKKLSLSIDQELYGLHLIYLYKLHSITNKINELQENDNTIYHRDLQQIMNSNILLKILLKENNYNQSMVQKNRQSHTQFINCKWISQKLDKILKIGMQQLVFVLIYNLAQHKGYFQAIIQVIDNQIRMRAQKLQQTVNLKTVERMLKYMIGDQTFYTSIIDLLPCIIRYLSKQPQNCQVVNLPALRQSLTYYYKQHKRKLDIYRTQLPQLLLQEKQTGQQNLSLIEQFLKAAMKQQLSNETEEEALQQLQICKENIKQMLSNQASPWLVNMDSSATLDQFLDHVHWSGLYNEINKWSQGYSGAFISQNPCTKLLKDFIRIFILKVNISIAMQFLFEDNDETVKKIQQKTMIKSQIKFAQFYKKFKSISSQFSKWSLKQVYCIFYKLTNGQATLTPSDFFDSVQANLEYEEKIKWLVKYNELIEVTECIKETQKQKKQQLIAESQQLLNLVRYSSSQNKKKQQKSIIQALQYEEYLLKAKISNDSKKILNLYRLHKNLGDFYDQLEDYKIQQKYYQRIFKYVQNIHEADYQSQLENPTKKEILYFLELYQTNFILRKDVKANFYSVNQKVDLNNISQVLWKHYKRYSKHPYLESYQALYQYCHQLLLKTLATEGKQDPTKESKFYPSVHTIRSALKKYIKKLNLNPQQFFNLLKLMTKQNLFKKLLLCLKSLLNKNIQQDDELSEYYTRRAFALQSLINYNTKGLQIKYPISYFQFNQMLDLVNQNQNKQLEFQIEVSERDKLMKELDLWGIGSVNLNDFQQYRRLNLENPYVNINQYLQKKYPIAPQQQNNSLFSKKHAKVAYISPPNNLQFQNIVSALINQQSVHKQKGKQLIKKIQKYEAISILYSYLTEEHFTYLNDNFGILIEGRQYYDLVGLVQWLISKKKTQTKSKDHSDQQNQLDPAEVIAQLQEKLVQQIQKFGGVYYYATKGIKLSVQAKNKGIPPIQSNNVKLFCQFILPEFSQNNKNVFQIYAKHFEFLLTAEKNHEELLTKYFRTLINKYNFKIRQWNNYNNPRNEYLRNLPASQWRMISMLYQQITLNQKDGSQQEIDIHKLFDKLAIPGAHVLSINFYAFEKYLLLRNISGYSRQDIKQVYELIDIDGDQAIQYKEFVRFWMALNQLCGRPTEKDSKQQVCKIRLLKQKMTSNLLDQLLHQNASGISQQVYFYDELQKLIGINNKEKMNKLLLFISQVQETKKSFKLADIPFKTVPKQISLHKLKTKVLKAQLKQFKKQNNKAKIDVSMITKVLQTSQNIENNYILMLIAPELLSYSPTHKFNRQFLQKWLLAKYNKLGYRIMQFLNDITGFKEDKIIETLSNHNKILQKFKFFSQLSNTQGTKGRSLSVRRPNNKILTPKTVLQTTNKLISSDKQQFFNSHYFMNQIKMVLFKIENLYKNYDFKPIKNRSYAQSIADRIVIQTLHPYTSKLVDELQQMSTFIQKSNNYEAMISYPSAINVVPVNQLKSVDSKMKIIIKQSEQIGCQKLDRMLIWNKYLSSKYWICYINSQSYVCQEIYFNNSDLKCKSGSKVNLHFNVQLYKNYKISSSLILFNPVQSKPFKQYVKLFDLLDPKTRCYFQQAIYTVHSNKYTPIVHAKINMEQYQWELKATIILEIGIKIIEMLQFMLKQNQITGLLVNLDNVEINIEKINQYCLKKCKQHSKPEQDLLDSLQLIDIKFRHFFTAIQVDKEGTYNEGINFNLTVSNIQGNQRYPPQIDQGVYNTSLDVYQFAKIMFHLYNSLTKQISQEGLDFDLTHLSFTSQQPLWVSHSKIYLLCLNFLLNETKDQQNHKYKVSKMLFSLVYDSMDYNWYERPTLSQVKFTLNSVKQMIQSGNYMNISSAKYPQKIKSQYLKLSSNKKQSEKLPLILQLGGENHEQLQNDLDLTMRKSQDMSNFKTENILPLFKVEFVQDKIFEIFQTNQLDMNKKVSDMEFVLKSSSKSYLNWKLTDITKFISYLKDHTNVFFFMTLNTILLFYLSNNIEDEAKASKDRRKHYEKFMTIVVDYLLMMNPFLQPGLCLSILGAYKQIISHQTIKEYLKWCQKQWRISEFDIGKKIDQLNMKNRIRTLHKSSDYYKDLTILAQCRVNMFQKITNANIKQLSKNQTSKKMALNFIQASLVSNNVNKVYAVYKTQIIKYLYLFIQNAEIGSKALQILKTITMAVRKDQKRQSVRNLDEAYKVMMIIYQILQCQGKIPSNISELYDQKIATGSQLVKQYIPTSANKFTESNYRLSNYSRKKNLQQQNTIHKSVVSLLSFLNNYYSTGGIECRESILKQICHQQIIKSKPLLVMLSSLKNNSMVQQIIINLSHCQQGVKVLSTPAIRAYHPRINNKKVTSYATQMKRLIESHFPKYNLLQLSCIEINRVNIEQLCECHIAYYQHLVKLQTKNFSLTHLNNFYNHYMSFLQHCQNICLEEMKHCQNDTTALKIIETILKTFYKLHPLYTQPKDDISTKKSYLLFTNLNSKLFEGNIIEINTMHMYTVSIISFLMKFLEQIYDYEALYMANKLLYNKDYQNNLCSLHPTQYLFIMHQILIENQPQLMLNQGYMHFYFRIIKKQYTIMQKYIQKGVENLHLIGIYALEAQYRLAILYKLLSRGSSKIHRTAVEVGLGEYIVQSMLRSSLFLDLRYFKIRDETVPYRFCHPLRSQAIGMIGYIISMQNSPIRNDICSRIQAYIGQQKKKLNSFDSQQQKVAFVQTLWLCANILKSGTQKLKYQIINCGIYERIKQLLETFSPLTIFFPEMNRTIKNGQLLSASVIMTKSILNSSKGMK